MKRAFVALPLTAVALALAAPAAALPVTYDMMTFGMSFTNVAVGPNGFYGRTAVSSWNQQASVGGFSFGSGFRVGGSTSGTLSFSSGYQMQGMQSSLDWSGRSQVRIEQVAARTYTLGTSLGRTAGSRLRTDGLKFGATASVAVDGKATVKGKGCVAGICDSGSKTTSFQASQSLLRLGTIGDYPFEFMGRPSGIDYGDPFVLTAGSCGDLPNCTVGMEVARITGYDPNMQMSGTSGAGAGLFATKSVRTVDASLDLDFLLTAYAGLPPAGLRAEVDPFDFSADLYDIKATLGLNLVQSQTFQPVPQHRYAFDRDVLGLRHVRTAVFRPERRVFISSCAQIASRLPGSFPPTIQTRRFGSHPQALWFENGGSDLHSACYDITDSTEYAPIPAGTTVSVDTDELLQVTSPDAFRAQVSTSIAPVLETGIDLRLMGSFDLDLLKLNADFKVYEKSLGPVYSGTLPLFSRDFSLYRERRYFGSQTCGMAFEFALDGVFADPSGSICGAFLPSGSSPEIEGPEPNDIASLPPLTGEPFEVPEPAPLGLLGVGVLAAACLRRRRR